MNNLQRTIIQAIEYINTGEKVSPRCSTIKSLLSGATSSPHYEFFKKNKQLFESCPGIKKKQVQDELDKLVEQKYLKLVEKDYVVNKIEKADKFSKLTFTNKEKELVNIIFKFVLSLNNDFRFNDKDYYKGLAYKDDEFNFVWISRNKKTYKLEVKIRKEFKLEADHNTYELSNKNISIIKSSIGLILNDKKSIIKDYEYRIKSKKDRFDEYNEAIVVKKDELKLMSHQKAGVEIALKFNKFAFFYDTGTGKTIMSLEIMSRKYQMNNNRFLVVAPKPLIKTAWMDDSEKFISMRLLPLSNDVKLSEYLVLYNRWLTYLNIKIEDRFILKLDENGKIKNELSIEDNKFIFNELIKYAQHFIINREQILNRNKRREFMEKYKFDSLIVDESSVLKNPSSRTFKSIYYLSKKMKNVYLLSGKPAPNTELEYYSQMKIVSPDVFSMDYSKFCNSFFVRKRCKFVPKNKKSKEQIADMVADGSLIVSKEDCIDLPEQVVEKINFKLNKEFKSKYDQVLERIVTCFMSEENKSVVIRSLSNFAMITKLRELTSGFMYDDNHNLDIFNYDKLNKFLEVLDNKIGKDKQVLIWCNFKYERDLLYKTLSNRGEYVVTADGDSKDLMENIRLFQQNKAKYLIANLKTLKYGVTLVNCYNTVFFSLSYSFEDYYQACARIHRKGQDKKSFVYIISAIDTIDTIICKCIEEKSDKSIIFEKLIKSYSKFNQIFNKDEIEKTLDDRIDISNHVLVVEDEIDTSL